MVSWGFRRDFNAKVKAALPVDAPAKRMRWIVVATCGFSGFDTAVGLSGVFASPTPMLAYCFETGRFFLLLRRGKGLALVGLRPAVTTRA